jgi:pyruvate dehydrogenase kinase 2/3/4
MPSVHEIKRQYIESFDTAYHAVTPDSPETEAAFTAQLREIFSRHSHLLMLLGRGLLELKGHGQIFDVNTSEGPGSIQSHLDIFYSERIALRTMIQHHIELHGKQRAGSVGVFRRETDPVEIAYSAIEVAKGVCMHAKGEAPDVRVVVGRHPRLTLPLIPDHLFYLLTELLKNSMRATIDTHGIDDPPPVSVVITAGDEDITIKVSDQGGGIPRSELPSIWSYLYTTAETDPIALIDDVADDKFQQRAPLAGFGCGLPISRCYARFFGGDLQILSLDGFGTDAFVHLPRDAAAREV